MLIIFLREKRDKNAIQIVGIHNPTRALQSPPFQNPGGGGAASVVVAGLYFRFLILDEPHILNFTTANRLELKSSEKRK